MTHAGADIPGLVIEAEWFDGRSARPRPVRVRLDGAHLLIEAADDDTRHRVALDGLRWPAADRHGGRILTLPDGGSLHTATPGTWRALAREAGEPTGLADRMREHLGTALLVTIVVIGIAVGIYRYAVPWVAVGIVAVLPHSVDDEIGRAAMASIDGQLLTPSALPRREQERIHRAFDAMLERSQVDRVPVSLMFRASQIGPNAFALPGGRIVMTDEMLDLADGDIDMVLGVLAHEYGHVVERHGMRLLLQSTLLSALIGLVTGDVGGLIAGAPLLMSQLAYSRDNEREADEIAIRMLVDSGRSPAVLAELFRRLTMFADAPDDGALGVLLSSHPPTAERIESFEEAARQAGMGR